MKLFSSVKFTNFVLVVIAIGIWASVIQSFETKKVRVTNTVSTESVGGYLQASIEDNGVPIDVHIEGISWHGLENAPWEIEDTLACNASLKMDSLSGCDQVLKVRHVK